MDNISILVVPRNNTDGPVETTAEVCMHKDDLKFLHKQSVFERNKVKYRFIDDPQAAVEGQMIELEPIPLDLFDIVSVCRQINQAAAEVHLGEYEPMGMKTDGDVVILEYSGYRIWDSDNEEAFYTRKEILDKVQEELKDLQAGVDAILKVEMLDV